MGIVKSSGSISLKNEYVPPSEMEDVVDVDKTTVHPTPHQRVDSELYIKNTVESANAIPDDSKLIQAMSEFVTGIPVIVTFYHVINNDTFGRSFSSDFDRELDPVHTSYLKINNFQMRLKDSMQFGYETETTVSQQTGEAVLYPYFCPNIGDIFLYELPNKRTGVFKITEAPGRLAIHDTTCHEIKFKLMEFLTKPLKDKIEASVAEVAYFNLKRYLADSGALLTSNETDILNKANASFSVLANAYGEEFYNTDTYNTFVEDVKQYDPYVVEFITRVIETSRLPGYPTQLLPNPPNWKRSFWFKLLDPKMVPDNVLINKASRSLCKVNYRTARVNALANRNYIEINPKGEYNYPPFVIPCAYTDNIISVPMQLSLYFTRGQVRPAAIMKLAEDVLAMRRIARFYYIPVLLFLLKKLILALSTGKEEMILNSPVTEECMQDCENCCYMCERNGEVINCVLPKDPPGCIVSYIPACGGSTTDDDSTTTPPPYRPDWTNYDICNKIWKQHFDEHGHHHGDVHMFPTDVFYTKEQIDQQIKSINTEIQTPDISALPDSTNILKDIKASVSALSDGLDSKVDKVSGKTLSTHDFDDDYKEMLDNLEGAVNIPDASEDIKGIVQLAIDDEVEVGKNTTKAITPKVLKTELDRRISAIPKPDMGSKEDVINKVGDFDVIDDTKYPTTKAVSEYVTEELLDKVDVVAGMGLSTNDFTNDLKSKLENLEGSLPDATTESAGIIRIATEEEVEVGESDDSAVVPSTLKVMLDTKAGVNEIPNVSGKEETSNKVTDFDIVDDIKYPTVKAVVEYLGDAIERHGFSAVDSVEELSDDDAVGRIGIVVADDAFDLYQKQEDGWARLEYSGLSGLGVALQAILGDQVEPNPIWKSGKDAPELKYQFSPNGEDNWHNDYEITDFWTRYSVDGGYTYGSAIRMRGDIGCVSWLGSRTDVPENPSLHDAYYNPQTGRLFVYETTGWSQIAEINNSKLVELVGTSVDASPWEQYKWIVDGDCELSVEGFSDSGFETAMLLITFLEDSTLSMSDDVIVDDIVDMPGVYLCYLINEDGIVHFRVASYTEAE